MEVKKIAVLGAGLMGHGIAQVAAQVGKYEVSLRDIKQEFIDRGMDMIRNSLQKFLSKGVISEAEMNEVLARIHPTIDLKEAVSDADLIIEAVPENIELKKSVFSEVDSLAPPHAIIASNTSSISITELASATNRPEKVCGMHFFNPPPLMPLVEITRGSKTSDETVKITFELAKKFGKQPIIVNKDIPGFVVNRILLRFLMEACWQVYRGKASIEEIDSAVKYKLGFPMGAFELLDYSGIDIFYSIAEALIERGTQMHICPLLKEKFESKEYGVKSGKGFYRYPEPGKYVKPSIPKEVGEKIDEITLIAPAINEAAYLIREGIVSKEDLDKATELGLGYPKGILRYADDYGIDIIVDRLNKLKEETGWDEYEPDPLLKEMVEKGKLGRKAGEGFYKYAAVEERKLENILVRIEPPIAWVVLNKPEKLNALTISALKELNDVFDTLEVDDRVRVVILTGVGKAFCAGADVSTFKDMSPIDAMIYSRRFQELTTKIEFYTKPVIAAINGYALGGGMELALAADFRIASEVARLGQPEINLGIIPGAGATQRLPRLIGRSKAKSLIYTGDMIPADEAYKIGMVDKVVPPEKLEDEARSLALKLAEKPRIALIASKYAINYGLETDIWHGLALESQLFGLIFSTEDAKEGINAFLEKRKPKFKGR